MTELYEANFKEVSKYVHATSRGHEAIQIALGMQLTLIKADGKTVLFAADLFPTHAHVPLPWVMGYDMQPLRTLAEKESILSAAADGGWFGERVDRPLLHVLHGACVEAGVTFETA